MRGFPKFIQTREDLQNLFEMVKAEKLDKAELAERVRSLLGLQYHNVPAINVDGAKVTTGYFAEVSKDDVTAEGFTVKKVEHKKDPDGEDDAYAETVVTLSEAAPEGFRVLSIFVANNPLVLHGFDVEEIKYILGVLEK